MRVIQGIVLALLLTGCSRGVELRDCTKGLEDIDLVIDRNAEKYGPWVEDVADRLVVKCVPPKDIGLKENCWFDGLFGCTVRLGSSVGNLTGNPPHKALVVAAQDVSVSRLLCHEIPAHWRDGWICATHDDDCFGKDVRAFEAECKKGIR